MPYCSTHWGLLYYTRSRAPLSPQTESGGDADTDQRPPLVLVHGAGETTLHWPPELRYHRGWPVYALDLPGHGRSEGEGQTSVEAYAQSVLDFLQKMKLGPVVLGGHSMGGAIVLYLARYHPELVAAGVLVSTGARLRVSQELLDGIENDFVGTTARLIRRVYGHVSEFVFDQSLKQLRGLDPLLLRGDFAAADGFDMMDELAQLIQPFLAICGDRDDMTPRKYSEHLYKELPNCELYVLPDAGHMVQVQQSERVTELVLAFLQEQVDPKRAT